MPEWYCALCDENHYRDNQKSLGKKIGGKDVCDKGWREREREEREENDASKAQKEEEARISLQKRRKATANNPTNIRGKCSYMCGWHKEFHAVKEDKHPGIKIGTHFVCEKGWNCIPEKRRKEIEAAQKGPKIKRKGSTKEKSTVGQSYTMPTSQGPTNILNPQASSSTSGERTSMPAPPRPPEELYPRESMFNMRGVTRTLPGTTPATTATAGTQLPYDPVYDSADHQAPSGAGESTRGQQGDGTSGSPKNKSTKAPERVSPAYRS